MNNLSNSFAYACPGMIRDKETVKVKDIPPAKADTAKTSMHIQLAIQSHFGLDIQQLRRKVRARKYVFPRQISMYLHVRNTRMTKMAIGRMYGGMDHTTVIHSERKITDYLEQKYESLEKTEILEFFNKYGFEL